MACINYDKAAAYSLPTFAILVLKFPKMSSACLVWILDNIVINKYSQASISPPKISLSTAISFSLVSFRLCYSSFKVFSETSDFLRTLF